MYRVMSAKKDKKWQKDLDDRKEELEWKQKKNVEKMSTV